VPAAQQTLLFAGCSLPDEGLLEEHLHLDMYSLAQEVGCAVGVRACGVLGVGCVCGAVPCKDAAGGEGATPAGASLLTAHMHAVWGCVLESLTGTPPLTSSRHLPPVVCCPTLDQT
jgi:hypothetical protein